MKKRTIIIILLLMTILGGVLRFWDITKNPVSLNIDEIAYGINAYSILKTGRDEYGVFLPLTFKSVGDYKSPILIYSLVPAIALFGLNEFAIRFTTALVGVLSIPMFYLLLTSLTKKNTLALVGTGLLTISPWHIYYSRISSDHLMALFFLISGMYFFIKMLNGGKKWAIGAALFLALSMYTYHSEKVLIPPLIFITLILNWHSLIKQKNNLLIFLSISFVFLLILMILTIFGKAGTRAGIVFISQDIDFTSYVILDHIQKGINETFLLFFFWVKRYLNYFQPNFLFFNGLNMTLPGTIGLGVMYLFEIPWLLLGIAELIKQKIPHKAIIILWVLIGILPASITNNEQSAGRALIIAPPLVLISAFGAIRFYSWIKSLKIHFQISFLAFYSVVIIITFIHAFLIFAVHFAYERDEAFMAGTKEAVLYAIANQDNYQEIVFDPKRGVDVGDIISVPYMYFLFYDKYDPSLYHKELKNFTEKYSHFGKFTIRSINWGSDREKVGTLFIGSPWSLPSKDVKESEILKRIYLTNGREALLIVTPKH